MHAKSLSSVIRPVSKGPLALNTVWLLDAMPGAHYSAEDKATEADFCSIDFYSGGYALCFGPDGAVSEQSQRPRAVRR